MLVPTQIQKWIGHYNYPKLNRWDLGSWIVHEVQNKILIESEKGGIDKLFERVMPSKEVKSECLIECEDAVRSIILNLSDHDFLYTLFRFGLVDGKALPKEEMRRVFGMLTMKQLDKVETAVCRKLRSALNKDNFSVYLTTRKEASPRDHKYERFVGRIATVKDAKSPHFERKGKIDRRVGDLLSVCFEGETINFEREQLQIRLGGYRPSKHRGEFKERVKVAYIVRRGFKI